MHRTLVTALSATLIALLLCATAPLAASATATASGTMVAPGARPELYRDEGPAPVSARLRLALLLRYRDDAALRHLIDEQGDPSSPLYHHYLSAAQFRATFAPDGDAYARVAATLRHAGFRIDNISTNRTVLDASAPVAQIERFFGTSIHRVLVDGRQHVANVLPAYLPAELRRDVAAVDGFNDVTWFKNALQIGTRMPIGQDLIHGRLRGPAPWHALGPRAFAEGYDLPVQHAVSGASGGATYDGTGRVTGLISISDPLDSDLATWLSYFSIVRTGTTKRIAVDGRP